MKPLAEFMVLMLVGQAQAPSSLPAPPTTRVTTCVSADCHARETRFKFLHAPAAAGACEMCHQPLDVAKHTFTYKQTGAAMCDFCHIGKTGGAGLHVHEPVQQGQCIACHNPHGSDLRNLIKGDSLGGMCLTCHQDVVEDRAHLHTPVGQGECLSCHQAHSSVLPQLLVQLGRELCISCHKDVMLDPEEATAIALPAMHNQGGAGALGTTGAPEPTTSIHPPVSGECSQCHDTHGSNELGLLKENLVALCTSCHQEVAHAMTDATVHHSAVSDGKACLNCHEPHQSIRSHMLKNQPIHLCLDCHRKETTRADGTKIAAMQGLDDPNLHKHGPLAEGDCIGCHNVHGSQHRSLLTHPYTQEFYQAPDSQGYSLCFSCHKPELATEKVTTTATGFRNGDLNLHFVHVTAPGDQGRSCRACHSTHTSHNPQQLLDAVPYGQWSVPINFTGTETGGTCGAGCHRARSYDRQTIIAPE